RFEKDGEGVGALEGPLDGLSAIASLAEEHQIIMLQAAIEQALSGGEAIGDLYNAWRSGNQSDLAAFILDPSQFHPAIHDAVLTKRNQAWIDPILAYLDTPEEEFIAVGAGHLIGPGDLITLLKEAGVTAERLH
ncbi:MAG: TraB/GumN family protein, partial [Pseudomonadota bacterium]